MASYKKSTRPEFAVEKDTFRVNKRPVPDGDVVAIVAPQCRLQRRSFTNPFEQLRQQNTPFIAGIHRGCIEPYKYCLGARVARVYREVLRYMPKAHSSECKNSGEGARGTASMRTRLAVARD